MDTKKKLYKSHKDQVICGVCGGVAEYFDVDPTIVRVIWAAIICFAGSGIWLYIICAIVMQEEPSNPDKVVDVDEVEEVE